MSDHTRRGFTLSSAGLFILILTSLVLGALLNASLDFQSKAPHDLIKPEDQSSSVVSWTCSMHPQVNSPSAGLCPLCGMDLTKAIEDSSNSTEEFGLRLSSRASALAKIQTSSVELRALQDEGEVLWGEVSVDDDQKSVVSSWMSGRVERLFVSKVGEEVKRGQALAELYSPELYSAHQALISTIKSGKSRSHQSILKATREKLRLLGVSKAQLRSMEKADKPWKRIMIRSNTAGVIVSTHIETGSYVSLGQALFKVASLSKLQVKLRLNEYELQSAQVGQRYLLSVPSLSGIFFEGILTLIEPELDRRGRFTLAQISLRDGGYTFDKKSGEMIALKGEKSRSSSPQLLPGMLMTAQVWEPDRDQGLRLSIPKTAPLFAGDRSLVYVAQDHENEEYYQARTVILGSKVGEYYPVLSGLERGERVVTRGAFLLDSESQIRGMFSLSALASLRAEEKSRSQIVSTHNVGLSKSFASTVERYLSLQEALADSNLVEAKKIAKDWRETLSRQTVDDNKLEGLRRRVARVERSLWNQKKRLLEYDLPELIIQENLEGARSKFKIISDHLLALITAYGNPLEEEVNEAYCPMAFNNRGGRWLQRSGEINNVYFGDQMRRCGVFKRHFKPPSHSIKGMEQ